MQPSAVSTDGQNRTIRRYRRPPRHRTAGLLDRRTRQGKRANELFMEFKHSIGGRLTPAQQLACTNAAMLSAYAELLQAKHLAGETQDIEQLVRVTNLAQRARFEVARMWRTAPERS